MSSGYLIDWSKTPEITITKRLCPLCKEPTGKDSKCHEIMKNANGNKEEEHEFIEREDGSLQLHVRTMEIDGSQEPVLSEQCYYRRYDSWFFNCNFPISQELALKLSSIEGIEKLIVVSAYRGEMIVADHFDVENVLNTFKESYTDFCNSKLQECMILFKVKNQLEEQVEQLQANDQLDVERSLEANNETPVHITEELVDEDLQ